jgi:hypothetical protein
VNVNIANIPMPTEEQRAEMRALDAKLDAFAKLIKDKARCPDTAMQLDTACPRPLGPAKGIPV